MGARWCWASTGAASASSESPAAHAGRRRPPPSVFITGFNKAAGFAARHFSWRCFPSRVGGWQRLAKSGDLSLVCLRWPGREACSEVPSSARPAGCTQSLAGGRANLSFPVTGTRVLAHVGAHRHFTRDANLSGSLPAWRALVVSLLNLSFCSQREL